MKKLLFVIGSLFSFSALAETTIASEAVNLAPLAKAICISLAVIGAAYAQGKAASTALEGIARNPSSSEKMFVPLILALAFMEALAILAFVIALGI